MKTSIIKCSPESGDAIFDDLILNLILNYMSGEQILKNCNRVNKNWYSHSLKIPLFLTINVEDSYVWFDSEVQDVDERIVDKWIEKLKGEL